MDRREQWGDAHTALATRTLLILAIPVVFGVIGLVIPAAMPNGLAALPADREAAGRHALAHAYVDCLDKFDHLFIRRQRLYWLDPEWQPGFEDAAAWPDRVVARVRGYTLFGIPADETSVFAGGGSACRRVPD